MAANDKYLARAVSSSVNSPRARGMLLGAKSFYIGSAKQPEYDLSIVTKDMLPSGTISVGLFNTDDFDGLTTYTSGYSYILQFNGNSLEQVGRVYAPISTDSATVTREYIGTVVTKNRFLIATKRSTGCTLTYRQSHKACQSISLAGSYTANSYNFNNDYLAFNNNYTEKSIIRGCTSLRPAMSLGGPKTKEVEFYDCVFVASGFEGLYWTACEKLTFTNCSGTITSVGNGFNQMSKLATLDLSSFDISHDALVKLFRNFPSATTKLSLGSNLAKVTDAEVGIATAKGWQVTE